MADVSNKTIAGVLLVSIAVSLVGTLISLSKLSSLGPVRVSLTGGATANGSVTLNVSETVSINLTDSVINFGNGFVNESGTAPCNVTTNGSFVPGSTSRWYCYCDLGTGNDTNSSLANGTYSVPDSTATGYDKNTTSDGESLNATKGFCAGFKGNATNVSLEYIELENTGTIAWSTLRVYATDPDTWIGGGTSNFPDEQFQGGCQNKGFTRAANASGASVVAPYFIGFNDENNGAPGAICARDVPSADANDRIRFEAFVRVPKDALLAGQSAASVIFVAGG